MAYATVAQFATLLGTTEAGLSAEQRARAELLLDLAAGVIDDELGQSLIQEETTVELDGTGTDVLLLPRWPVTAMASVTVIDDLDEDPVEVVEDVDFRWSRDGRLRRLCRCWPCVERAVTVTYTAGYPDEEIPAGIQSITLRLARQGWENPGGKESERLGDWNAKWARAEMLPTTAEKAKIGLYRART